MTELERIEQLDDTVFWDAELREQEGQTLYVTEAGGWVEVGLLGGPGLS